MSSSAIDSMLKSKGLEEGSLYSRIDKAAAQHIITDDVAKWAHQVRLVANGERHADETATMPTTKDALLAYEFAESLGEILFVLPAKVSLGLTRSGKSER
jgi:hypothetical protein